jgi:hypothetical protein
MVRAMSAHDVLISGTPRSGTTLTCHLLNKVGDTVALHEPMRVKRLAELPSLAEVPAEVQRFCEEQRQSLHERGRAISKNVGGAVPDNPHGSEKNESGLRKSKASKSEIVVDKPLSPDFTLVVKHNAAFTAALGELVKEFRVYAVMRNPLAVVTSWNSIDFNAGKGHVPAGERLDPGLRDALAGLDDPLDRQMHILDWFHSQWHRHLPPEQFIRYEDVVESGGKSLAVITPGAAELDEPLESRNLSKLYDRELMLRIGERLLASDGAQWESYPRESVERLLEVPAADG